MVSLVGMLWLTLGLLTSCATQPVAPKAIPVHVPEALTAPTAAPEIATSIRISDYPKLLLKALGALQEANADKAAVRSIVDKHNQKVSAINKGSR